MLKSYKWNGLGLDLWTHLCYEHRSAVLITMRRAGLSVSVNSIQISGNHFLDCKSWSGMAGNVSTQFTYCINWKWPWLRGWVWEFPPILVSRDAAAEGRASLVRVTRPSHQMITRNLPVLHNLINEQFNIYTKGHDGFFCWTIIPILSWDKDQASFVNRI